MRKYGDNLQRTAALIAAEVVAYGSSSGWSGNDFNFFKSLKEHLSQFNIIYVNDLTGEWQKKD